MLLVLTPANYSSNNTRDTPGRRAFISPAQDQLECSACVGFAATAAAEAAINVYLQQNWVNTNLSEQDLSFCRLVPKPVLGPLVNCKFGAEYDALNAAVRSQRL
uniref:Peptidase C1A papain C-terminal domain-containing protein n=1 Tax=Tetradesmus obliquus TaxID=3088 RepID=A0A383VBJ7_TETOB|eukprot:jgi/Sobl393_1/3648/SZX62320.1